MKIPAIPLVATPNTADGEAAIGFKWAGKPIGHRHRIGGEPEWIRAPAVPVCSCAMQMSFYGQLDSVGDQYCLADAGMIYVFVCWDCFETKSVLQSF